MKKYTAFYTVDAVASIVVEAKNKKEAKEIAKREMWSPGICHQCSSKIELGDPLKVIDIIEGEI